MDETTIYTTISTCSSNVRQQYSFTITNKKVYFNRGNVCEEYNLNPILDMSEIISLRLSDKPVLLLKYYDKFFYAYIDSKLGITNLEKHCCSSCTTGFPKTCKKIADLDWIRYIDDFTSKETAIIFSKRIEKYSFIEIGFETFNCKSNAFVVSKCRMHNKIALNSLNISTIDKRIMIESLKDFMYK